jgi:hypothetical protein
MKIIDWIADLIVELFRGLGLIIRDVHQFFKRRVGVRIWWIYLLLIFVAFLWATGQLWGIIISLLTLAIVLFGLWLMVKPLLGGKKKK